MSRTVLIWTAGVTLGLLIAVAQKLLFDTSPAIGLATVALFTVGAVPASIRVAALFEAPRPRRERPGRLMAI